MKRTLFALATVVIIAFSLSQCTAHRSSVYASKMDDLRSQVHVGDNIYDAAKKIEGRYHGTMGPHAPNKLGKELWLHVSFGLQPTFVETLAYTADVTLPFDKNEPISAVIKANSKGTIISIE